MSYSDNPQCPVCFVKLTIDLEQNTLPQRPTPENEKHRSSIVNRILSTSADGITSTRTFPSSTKIEALLEELNSLRRLDRTIKSIVFSQFVNFLDIIHWRLNRAGRVPVFFQWVSKRWFITRFIRFPMRQAGRPHDSRTARQCHQNVYDSTTSDGISCQPQSWRGGTQFDRGLSNFHHGKIGSIYSRGWTAWC
jgi:hypothetical protein